MHQDQVVVGFLVTNIESFNYVKLLPTTVASVSYNIYIWAVSSTSQGNTYSVKSVTVSQGNTS